MTSLHPFDLLSEIDRRNTSQVAPPASKTAQALNTEGRLALRLGQWNLLFSMQDVSEIVPVPRITRVPRVKSWLMGIANSRGTVISVVDLREFLGGKPAVPTHNSRLVIIRSSEWGYGLLVDEVIGMRHFGAGNRMVALYTLDAKLRPYVTEAFEKDSRKWVILDVNRLVSAPEFLDAIDD
jgi:twitching motility protein PilI